MIEFDSVSKSYPGGSVAVANFSLTIPSRTTVALVGSSGSGKTTLLRMVNRMVEPESGRVLIDGSDVADANPVELRRSIGYVLQAGGLMPHWTVQDNIASVMRLNGASRSQSRSRAAEMMNIVGLESSLLMRYPHELSGGQQQRVGVARALAPDPHILLMDEPFGAVDPITRRELQHELLRIQRELSKTIVFVTHDIDEAFLLGDTVAILSEQATIAQHDAPEDIVAAPSGDFVRNFIDAKGAGRSLSTRRVHGRTLVVDGLGVPVGVLVS